MSWFDPSGIANIAKSALKEAQRTIDKALDIKDDDPQQVTDPAETPIDTNSDDFFGNWGIAQSGPSPDKVSSSSPESSSKTTASVRTLKSTSSLWGSFTGSFFDAHKEAAANQSQLTDLLDDSIDFANEQFSGSKLVVQTSEDSDRELSRVNSCEGDEEVGKNEDSGIKRRDKQGNSFINRLSVISSESDRKSSESVEVLGNNSSFTTTPDSEMVSTSASLSSSAKGSKLPSDSVEVIPNSLTSPSSVEVLDFDSRRHSQYTDEFVSPLESPAEILCFPEKSSPDSIDSVEVIEDTGSIAEDTISYNSLSECTAATVLETPSFPANIRPLKPQNSDNFETITLKQPRASTSSQSSPSKSLGSFSRQNSVEKSSRFIPEEEIHLEMGGKEKVVTNEPQMLENDFSSSYKSGDSSESSIDNLQVKIGYLEVNLEVKTVNLEVKTDLEVKRPNFKLALQNQDNPLIKTKILEEESSQFKITEDFLREQIITSEPHSLGNALSLNQEFQASKLENLQFAENSAEKLTKANNLELTREKETTSDLSPVVDQQPQSSSNRDDFSSVMDGSSNVIDIPERENDSLARDDFFSGIDDSSTTIMGESNDDSSQSDKTLAASDYNPMETSSETSTTTESNSNLKTMLADAMSDNKSNKTAVRGGSRLDDGLGDSRLGDSRLGDSSCLTVAKTSVNSSETSFTRLEVHSVENSSSSPVSSESRSDLVKIAGVSDEHTSAHTSGDELETTTSSDIEIISSPNGGDSSSAYSRHSPAKLGKGKSDANVDTLLEKMAFKKIKGHNRELSGASSISDDCEIDRLIKRVSEMTEILESREAKLIEVSRTNAELAERNGELTRQLDGMQQHAESAANVSLVTEEYTQRLSALERKFQQVIREKDTARKQLDECRKEVAGRLSKSEIDNVLVEKESVIKELREEGEKLSKQQLQHGNIIKKLRAKEKEHETTIKHLKESIEDLTTEGDRLKRSLAAKDEVERSQIEAVHLLTAKNKKLEHDVNLLKSQVDDLTQKYDTVKKSLVAAKKELLDKNRTTSELAMRENMLHSLENEKRMTDSQNEEIINQLEDLRGKLRSNNEDFINKETILRGENNELLRRLEKAESRNEELTQSIIETTKPLMRQLENLQATHTMKLTNFELVEQSLMNKISDLQSRLKTAIDSERLIKEEFITIKSQLSLLEAEMKTNLVENQHLRSQYEQEKTFKVILERDLKREIENIQISQRNNEETIEILQKENESLRQSVLSEKKQTEVEKRRNTFLQQEQSREKEQERNSPLAAGSISPVLSLGRVSLSESLGSTFWPMDDTFDTPHTSRTQQQPSLTNSLLEMQTLHTNLKQREGSLQQLHWELNRREHERGLLNAEIAGLLARCEGLEGELRESVGVQERYEETKREYDTLCQLYGEKVEETEELRLDLEEVKEMYRLQIEELLGGSEKKS